MARTYKRDTFGRFAGGGGGGGRPKARSVARGANRLTRDNAGRITSVGGVGATARGGRLRTAGGKQRAVQTARVKGGGANTIAKGGNGISGSVARSVRSFRKARAQASAAPGARRKPLRGVGAAVKGNLKGFAGLPVSIRNKSEASRAYRARTNAMGRKAAGSRSITESEKRLVVGRPKISQMTLSGRVERVGSGRLRPIGERGGSGRIYRDKPDRSPVPGSPRAKRNRAAAIAASRELGAAGLFQSRS